MNTQEFLTFWFDGAPCFPWTLNKKTDRKAGQTFTNYEEAANFCLMQNMGGANVYFHVNIGADTGKGRTSYDTLQTIIGLQADVDPPAHITPDLADAWRQDVIAKMTADNATCIIISGRGVQGLWKLATPLQADGKDGPTVARIKRINGGLRNRYDGDNTIDPTRVMKLPGMTAIPDDAKRAKGWTEAPTFVAGGTGALWTPEELEAGLAANIEADNFVAPPPAGADTGSAVEYEENDAPITDNRRMEIVNKINALIRGGKNGGFADWGMPTQPQYGDGASEVWSWMIRAALEITDRRDIVHEVLFALPFVELTYKPTGGNETRRAKCERDFTNYFKEAWTLTAPKRKTGTLEGLQEMVKEVTSADEIAQHTAFLSSSEKKQLQDYAVAHNPAVGKGMKAAVQQVVNAKRVESGQQAYDMLTQSGELGQWFAVGDDGTGKPAAVNRRTMSRIGFQNFLTAHRFLPDVAMPGAGDKVVMVPAAQHWWDEPGTERYHRLEFNPLTEECWIDENEHAVRNTYVRPNVPAVPGDISMWLDLIDFQITDPLENQVFHTFMALLAQRPGCKFDWALGCVGMKGAGKSTSIEVARYLTEGKYGKQSGRYTLDMKAHRIGLQFNAQLDEKLLVYVHEMEKENSSMFKQRAERATAIKDMITSPHNTVEKKGSDGVEKPAYFNMIACANPEAISSFMLDADERRWGMVRFTQDKWAIKRQFGNMFWAQLYMWFYGGGMASVAHYYQTYHIAQELDPMQTDGNAPITQTFLDVVGESKCDYECLLDECIEEGDNGFKNGWVSVSAWRRAIEGDPGLKPLSDAALSRILKVKAYRRVGKARNADSFGPSVLWAFDGRRHNVGGRVTTGELQAYQDAQGIVGPSTNVVDMNAPRP